MASNLVGRGVRRNGSLDNLPERIPEKVEVPFELVLRKI
jgi:hypothetical protein